MKDEAGPLFGLSTRQPPANVQAEQGLLGAILSNPKAFGRVEGFLEPKHFADPVNARIFEAAARRLRSGGIADPITLKLEFENSGALDEVGGMRYLSQLVTAMVGLLNAGEYGRSIVDAWVRRQLIESGEAMVNRAFADHDLDGTLREAMASIERVTLEASTTTGHHRAKTLIDAVDAALAQAEAARKGDGLRGITTGMATVDDALGGFENGDLIVLGGRPGSGKSSLAWQWAINAARRGDGVLAISMEMTAAALGRRALSTASGVPIWKMRRGEHEDDVHSLLAARKEMLDLPLSIEDAGRASAAEIGMMCRLAQRRHGLGLIMVDHLQIARPDDVDTRNGSTAAVAAVAHAMKELAKRMDCPVLLLSQLNRALESRDDHRPTMSDLRQAGAIEEDADVVAFVYREELHLPKAPPERREGENEDKLAIRHKSYFDQKTRVAGKAELVIEKLRDGEPQVVRLLFDGPTASFREAKRDAS